MDVALSMSSTDSQHPPYDHLGSDNESLTPPLRAHRHLQYTQSSEAPVTSSVRRFHEPSTAFSARPQPEGNDQRSVNPDTASTTLAPSQSSPHAQWSGHNTPTSLLIPDGQDHDRMETDVDSGDSDSEEETDGERQYQVGLNVPIPPSEAMDITPDGLTMEDSEALNSSDVTSRSQIRESPVVHPEHVGLSHTADSGSFSPRQDSPSRVENASLPPENITQVQAASLQDNTVLSSSAPSIESHAQTQPDEIEQVPSTTDVLANAANGTSEPQQGENPTHVEDANTSAGNPSPNNADDAHSQDDDSSDDEDDDFWADLKEHQTLPDEQELKVIEENAEEVDALNHEHWEGMVYDDDGELKDPEYVPTDSGRIVWTVKPVNGTRESPNKETILRSQSVLIGGFYWNIKYFPRGNGGTEQMSVYIECSPSPPEASRSNTSTAKSPGVEEANPQMPSTDPVAAEEPSIAEASHSQTHSSNPHDVLKTDIESREPPTRSDSEDASRDSLVPWEIPAQIGCVVYNPTEPRVNAFSRSTHRYHIDNPDWGWTRFHGPWRELHKRRRYQRQALLQDDTLVLTAYIRTVKDDTKALWWHAPQDEPEWDSFERIGLQPVKTDSPSDSAIIAAVSTWAHLVPVVNLVRQIHIPNCQLEPQMRLRPLAKALQRFTNYMVDSADHLDIDTVSDLVRWIDWYCTQTDQMRFDMPEVVAIWETLRRVINYEASNVGSMTAADDHFKDMLLLKQPDPWREKQPISCNSPSETASATNATSTSEPRSIQEAVDVASQYPSRAFRPWETFCGRHSATVDFPLVLHLELHRQEYDWKSRRWNKLTHKIEINDQLEFPSSTADDRKKYTLFGFIAHSGALESTDFYSILRPQGPGTRWVKYAGGNHKKSVECLTTSQAIEAHEGSGEESKGSSKVAYLAIYVRSDSLSTALAAASEPTSTDQTNQKQANDATTESAKDAVKEETVMVRFYMSSLFRSHTGRGLPDLWDGQLAKVPDTVLELQFTSSTTVMQVEQELKDRQLLGGHASGSEQPHNSVKLWCLDQGSTTVRRLPRFISLHPKDRLGVLAETYEGCHFWLHTYYREKPTQSQDDSEPRDTLMSQEDAAADVSSTANQGGNDDQEERGTSAASELPQETIQQNAEQPAPPPEESVSQPPPPPPPPPPAAATAGGAGEATRGDGEDTVMDDAHDAAAEEAVEPAPSSQPEAVPETYFFVKYFDKAEQVLRSVGSSLAPCENRIHAEVARVLDMEDSFDLYQEQSRLLIPGHKIRTSWSFFDMGLQDGCVFIAHCPPSAAESTELASQAKHASPLTYFNYLHFNDNPRYLASHYVHTYFGTPYYSLSMQNAFAHGAGTMIATSGDAYVGNFVAGHKSGQGTMAYADQNMYVGSWAQDEPEGEGRMLYGKTGNVYEGGWKKGRRHGKGTMRFEVADEELSLCKICYESEMNALFYDCGHVAACDECARQVDHCPVCRRKVRAVCRIWKT